MDPTEAVRDSTARVVVNMTEVKINDKAIEKLAEKLVKQLGSTTYVEWNAGDLHYFKDAQENGPLTCQYVFVLDALNFCFWPTEGMEYEHLSRGLKKALEQDSEALNADRLQNITPATLSSWFSPYVPPQIDERVRKIQEIGYVLNQSFNGLALNMVKQANGSAVEFIRLVLANFPGFRDHTVYKGEQIYLYKRAQILVGDVWAAYGRRSTGICGFSDIKKLTMFADYRVPQILRPEGVLEYSEGLGKRIDEFQMIDSGSEAEVEIRAATVQAVERLHSAMVKLGHDLLVIELDWLLWQIGENSKDSIKPHHRTLTVFY